MNFLLFNIVSLMIYCVTVGVNMPDHGAMFATLTSSVTERITPHVASVHSNDCPNVHKMMAKVVSQVMDNTDVVDTILISKHGIISIPAVTNLCATGL